jgi:superfamily I DNA/RNA helicase
MWSEYQLAVFDAIEKESSSILVNAVAGSGKTTTLVESVKRVQHGSIIILAFGKKIADELRLKVSCSNVKITTLHANGLSILNTKKKRTVDQHKLLNVAQELKIKDEYFYLRAVTFLKDYGYPFTDIAIEDILEEQDFDFPPNQSKNEFIENCKIILDESNKLDHVVDFADMGYLPLLKDLQFRKYDWIFVDEAQDLNRLQQATIKKMMKPTTKIVAFGDKHQAIYGFRGADKDSFKSLETMSSAKVLPLSISYRCGKNIVDIAREKVPHIQSFEKADDGEVIYVKQDHFDVNDVRDALVKGVAVVSRYNKLLTTFAFDLAQKKIPFYFVNNKYSIGLKGLIKKYEDGPLDNLKKNLKKLSVLNDSSEMPNQALADKLDSILSIAEQPHVQTVKDLLFEIDKIFNNKSGVPLYTIHGAKGLEFDSVFFLGCDLLPSKYARSQWQLEQEDNLFYVAVTRAKKRLTMIEVKDDSSFR